MYKIILSIIFITAISSCKTFKGEINVDRGKSLHIKIIKDSTFADNDDENFEDDFDEEINLNLKSGTYYTALNFSSNKNLSLDIRSDSQDYTLDISLRRPFPDVEKAGKHKFFFKSKELKQSWGLKGSVKTKIHYSDLIKDVEYCSAEVRTWVCEKNKKNKKKSCKWVYDTEYGNRDVEYYNKTTNYKVFANIIKAAKSPKKDILGSFSARKTENIKIYEYESCCYNYYNRCIRHSRGRRH
ncbi:MAG: hypothetical protein HAW60_04855 [Bdellovibrionales bacterium]|nr:hypothetical protein [Bdellovibrionales bacterium]